jgi:hypothetical protein
MGGLCKKTTLKRVVKLARSGILGMGYRSVGIERFRIMRRASYRLGTTVRMLRTTI